jgi:hypothetical protein
MPRQGTDSSGILEVVRLPVSIPGVELGLPRSCPVNVVVSQTLCLHTVMCGTGLPPPIPLQMSPAAFEGWGNYGKSLCACKIDTWTKAGEPNNHS